MPQPKAVLLDRYDRACDRAAAQIIAAYSTSFTAATRLLRGEIKRDIRNLYAMVRIADELVDGAGAEAEQDPSALLDTYEQQVLAAPSHRLHTDPILHAYARTARRCQFNPEHVKAFFRSMRTDLTTRTFTQAELEEYIYGSAEVIGLMCLDVFLADEPSTHHRADLEHAARRLGAGFQKINFLRDANFDHTHLGRSYLAGTTRTALLDDARADLAYARTRIGDLPLQARLGVAAATDLYDALVEELETSDNSRPRVSNVRKVKVVASSLRKQLLGSKK